MKLFRKAKDGGPESTVTGYWLIEWKRLFSIVLLKFDDGSRDKYHSHAFGSLNWIVNDGQVDEHDLDGTMVRHRRSIWPVVTPRSKFHRVVSRGTTWVLSIRGPWSKTWDEFDPKTKETVTLTHGRQVVE